MLTDEDIKFMNMIHKFYRWDPKKEKYRIRIIHLTNTDDGDYFIHSETGLENGKFVIKDTYIPKAQKKSYDDVIRDKLIGTINKAKKDGFYENKNTDIIFTPMLLMQLGKTIDVQEKKLNKISDPCYQYKLDGVRCFTETLENGSKILLTRKREHIISMQHISNDINKLNIPDHVRLDGEIYYHNDNYVVTDISGLVNKKLPEEIEKSLPKILKMKFWIFDLYDESRPNLTFQERYEYLQKLFTTKHNNKLRKNIKILNVFEFDKSTFKNALDDAVEKGFEGIVIRDCELPYIPSNGGSSRSKNYKLKGKSDETFQIINITQANRSGNDFSIIFTLLDPITNKQFDVNGSGTFESQREFYDKKNIYIGRKLRIKYFSKTKYGIPFHATPLMKNKKYLIE